VIRENFTRFQDQINDPDFRCIINASSIDLPAGFDEGQLRDFDVVHRVFLFVAFE
jgi:hypothetical protein